LHAPFLIAAGAALVAGIIAVLVIETAPAVLNKKLGSTKPGMVTV